MYGIDGTIVSVQKSLKVFGLYEYVSGFCPKSFFLCVLRNEKYIKSGLKMSYNSSNNSSNS